MQQDYFSNEYLQDEIIRIIAYAQKLMNRHMSYQKNNTPFSQVNVQSDVQIPEVLLAKINEFTADDKVSAMNTNIDINGTPDEIPLETAMDYANNWGGHLWIGKDGKLYYRVGGMQKPVSSNLDYILERLERISASHFGNGTLVEIKRALWVRNFGEAASLARYQRNIAPDNDVMFIGVMEEIMALGDIFPGRAPVSQANLEKKTVSNNEQKETKTTQATILEEHLFNLRVIELGVDGKSEKQVEIMRYAKRHNLVVTQCAICNRVTECSFTQNPPSITHGYCGGCYVAILRRDGIEDKEIKDLEQSQDKERELNKAYEGPIAKVMEKKQEDAYNAGLMIPTNTKKGRYALVVGNSMCTKEEIEVDRWGYNVGNKHVGSGDWFDIKRVNTNDMDNIIENVEMIMKEGRQSCEIIVKVDREFSADDIARLKSVAPNIRIIKIDTTFLRMDIKDSAKRQKARFDIYAMMLAVRRMSAEDKYDNTSIYRTLKFYLNAYNDNIDKNVKLTDKFIEDLLNGNLVDVIKFSLSFRPSGIWAKPEPHMVTVFMMSA